MRTVAVYNLKGGVGKTATAVNLGFLAAQDGRRTLLWDLDPQGAASFYLRVKPKVKGGGRNLVKGRTAVDEVIRTTAYPGLDLLPADFSYRGLDLDLLVGGVQRGVVGGQRLPDLDEIRAAAGDRVGA